MDLDPPTVKWPKTHFNHWTRQILQDHGALELADARPSSLANPIHPIYALHKWYIFDSDDYYSIPPGPSARPYSRPLRENEYRLLRPSLRLASHFLTEPSLLPYWHALLFADRVALNPKDVTNVRHGHAGGFASFTRTYDINANSFCLSITEIAKTQHALRALADSTYMLFDPKKDEGDWGFTTRYFMKQGASGFAGTASDTFINISLLRALQSCYLTVSERLRVQYFLGVALVHEFAHAVHMARTPMLGPPKRSGTYKDNQWVHEPFFESDIVAECGHAWEQCVLNGSQVPFENSAECRFALMFSKWPGVQRVSPDTPTRRMRKGWSTFYALPMEFVQAMLTEKHWQNVGRYGASEVRAPKRIGWRVFLKKEFVVDEDDEGISWDNSSRGRPVDESGVVWPLEGAGAQIDPMDVDID
ncbi:MAG: hypothetical protein M1830_002735 [Pleopsidium flavum]|nr:MAG: hypothetical protein M1830_002735 [Pleopsidium flavum]